MAFQKGHKLAPGGARDGSGRPPDWLRQKCQEIIDKKAVLEFLGGVVAGENFEQVVNSDGEVIALPPPLKDRIKASELLLDRGYGKAAQSLALSNPDGSSFEPVSTKALLDFYQALEAGAAGLGQAGD